jgi:transcriptional regulator with XRE-family HTH domain
MLRICCRCVQCIPFGLVAVARHISGDTVDFGNRVRDLRLKVGLSQEGLGEAAGLHRTYIGHLERGEVNPSLTNILKVAAGLGVDAADLMLGLPSTAKKPRTA